MFLACFNLVITLLLSGLAFMSGYSLGREHGEQEWTDSNSEWVDE